MRKLAAAALAVPVVALLYVPVVLRQSIAARLGLAIGVGALLGIGAIGLAQPAPTVATPPQPPITAFTDEVFQTSIAADAELNAPVSITFSEPMDPASVRQLLEVQPRTALALTWDAAGTTLTVSPTTRWQPATYHTIRITPGALAQTGRPMSSAATAAFVTRPATTASILATDLVGDVAAIGTGFRITFDRPVDPASVRSALSIDPPIDGRIEASSRSATSFLFVPTVPLLAGTTYTVSLRGVTDAAGARVSGAPELAIATTPAPRVIRFRPLHRTTGVEQTANLSVRFTEPMDRDTTKRAWVASIGGKPIAGAVSFAESDTVLVFDPTDPLPYGAEVELRVNLGALARTGAPLAAASSVRILVETKPVASVRTSSGSSAGSAVGGGSWAAVETYYLGLMNCTRTGGWVTSGGDCSSPGGRNVAPLKLDSGISSKVARPYARLLATGGQCSHFIGGNPGDRLERAGYTSYIWAENLGCRSGNPYSAVLGSHLFFQSEKSYNGGHYVNMMNSKYDRAGIGVWVSGGRVRLVIDFYHPR